VIRVHLAYLACPQCGSDLKINDVKKEKLDRILDGSLGCENCCVEFPIVGGVPRFVSSENYAKGFGIEWNHFNRTQFDDFTGVSLSKKRFFEETKWAADLSDELILEVGSGAGRFTEHALATGALVVSLDYSDAVSANFDSNGHNDNLLLVQGDIYSMPFKKSIFDKLLCIGVLQHTPDPEKSFKSLPSFLKEGGSLVIDVYRKTVFTFFGLRYYVRPFTRNRDPANLFAKTQRYIDFMWPLSCVIRKIPFLGRKINWALLVPDYSGEGLSSEKMKDWAYLDIFDILSPRYDIPQTLGTVKRWFTDIGFDNTEIHYGYNGIEGRGSKPN